MLTLETKAYILGSLVMNVNEWYLLHISVAFPGCVEGQLTALAHYHIMS